MIKAENQWFGIRKTGCNAKLRIVALPYAGGGAAAYRNLFSDVSCKEDLDLIAIELPGRGRRLNESPISNLKLVMDLLYMQLYEIWDDTPVVLLGYSMGTILAYELALKFQSNGMDMKSLILCAGPAPSLIEKKINRGRLSDDELIDEVRKLGGTPVEVLNNRELMKYYLQILRADFSIADSYYKTNKEKLNCPIYAMSGIYDNEVSIQDTEEWRNFTNKEYMVSYFQDSHFFIHSSYTQFLEQINYILKILL